MILIVDFGSQTAHLIKRRISDFGIPSELILPENALSEISRKKPLGIIRRWGNLW